MFSFHVELPDICQNRSASRTHNTGNLRRLLGNEDLKGIDSRVFIQDDMGKSCWGAFFYLDNAPSDRGYRNSPTNKETIKCYTANCAYAG